MRILILAAFIIALVLSTGCDTEYPKGRTSKTSPPTSPAPTQTTQQPSSGQTSTVGQTVTAKEIYQVFKTTPAVAEQKYKGEIVKVTGVVEGLGKDATDTSYVMLMAGDTAGTTSRVKCTFEKGVGNEMAKVTTGVQVTIQGLCWGLEFNDLVIRNCSLIKAG